MSEYESFDAFSADVKTVGVYAFSTHITRLYTEARFAPTDALVFGTETRGLPVDYLQSLESAQRLRLPMQPNSRSMNLSNCVAVVVYEAWRQLGFLGGS